MSDNVKIENGLSFKIGSNNDKHLNKIRRWPLIPLSLQQ